MHVWSDHFEPRMIHLRPGIDKICLSTSDAKIRDVVGIMSSGHWFDSAASDKSLTRNGSDLDTELSLRYYDEQVPVRFHHLATPTARPAYLIPRYYAAISDVEGCVEIAGIESGRMMKFQLLHPDLGLAFSKTIVAGFPVDDSGSFELTLNDGINDIGEIDISKTVMEYIAKIRNAKP